MNMCVPRAAFARAYSFSPPYPFLAIARIAELEHPDSPELSVGQGHGYLWRLNDYWRLEEKDGGVYIQVESIALSRDVPPLLAWFVNPLIRRVSRTTLTNLLSNTRKGLLRPEIPQGSGCTAK